MMGTADKKKALIAKTKRKQIAVDGTLICDRLLAREYKKRWDNFDDEIEASIYAFCHDPNYVKPDNYSKQNYCCKDDNGYKCFHHRHNWFTTGSVKIQYHLYLESDHFRNLKQQILSVSIVIVILEEM
mmetsp:Transcript_16425/g.31119  ORF Transcript_16425/g.31119 Transcript_16425/m.31119 type:complete len:128 (+) Transcript_16425:769-1152(+)